MKFFEEFKLHKHCVINPHHQKLLGLAEVTFGLAHASDSFPEWKAVKLTFFATLMSSTCLFYLAWIAGRIVMIHAGTIFRMCGVIFWQQNHKRLRKPKTYFPIQMAYSGGRRGKNKIECAVSTSTAPKQSPSNTPNVQ